MTFARGLCRSCGESLPEPFLDLGLSPLSNVYPAQDRPEAEEVFYPLRVHVCPRCFLVQIQEFEKPERLFGDYAYFSSYSTTWLKHAERFADESIKRFSLHGKSRVVEVASNDGYLLQYFQSRHIPVLGVEPAANVAQVARAKGISTVVQFFGRETATSLRSEGSADLLLANNVMAHVPDVHDFVEGIRILLNPTGVATLEFPHLLRLLSQIQFDTIYHEHFSYFSLRAVERIFRAHALKIFDVEQMATHGGSLRIFVAHAGDATKSLGDRVGSVLVQEERAGLERLETYAGFRGHVERLKRQLLEMLIQCKNEGKSISAYGAAAKGNTLLNYCGIRTDFIDRVFDRNPAKQGKLLPGSRIPVVSPDQLHVFKPDYVLILPWNIEEEIVLQLSSIRTWGGTFVIPIPEPRFRK